MSSYQVPDPNAAFYDYKLEVTGTDSITCDYVLINPAESNRNTCGNDSDHLCISVVGVEEENDFELYITEGNTTNIYCCNIPCIFSAEEEEEVIFHIHYHQRLSQIVMIVSHLIPWMHKIKCT